MQRELRNVVHQTDIVIDVRLSHAVLHEPQRASRILPESILPAAKALAPPLLIV
jgi:hypothetical protein